MANGERQQLVDFWRSKGAPGWVAEGIADAVQGESGFDPLASGDGGTSIGKYQHHADRKARLQALPNWQDPRVQDQFAYSEVTGGDAVASAHWNEIKNARTREDAKQLWSKYFERPALVPGGALQRSVSQYWNVDPDAIDREDHVRWMSPRDYLDLVGPIEDTDTNRRKQLSLWDSLTGGEPLYEIPSLDVEGRGGKLKVTDWDGRNRAQFADEEGVKLIPVAIRGADSSKDYSEIQGARGPSRPFNFMRTLEQAIGIGNAEAAETQRPGTLPKPWEMSPQQLQQTMSPAQQPMPPLLGRATDAPKPWEMPAEQLKKSLQAPIATAAERADVSHETPPPGFWEREGERAKSFLEAPAYVVAGAARPLVGGAQLLAHGAEALGVPGAGTVAGATDTAVRGLEGFVARGGPEAPYEAGAGEIIGGLAVPAGRLAQIPSAVGRVAAGAGVGAVSGAMQPVTSPDYWEAKKAQTEAGLATGGALGAVGEAARVAGRIVSPGTLNRAAARLFGVDASRVTPQMFKDARKRIGDTLNATVQGVIVNMSGKPLTNLVNLATDAHKRLIGSAEHSQVTKLFEDINDKLAGPRMRGEDIDAMRWEGEPLDIASRSSHPLVKRYAQRIEDVLDNALEASLPPAVRATRLAAKAEYRDMMTLADATRIGRERASPKAYARAVEKRFPSEKFMGTAKVPKGLELGRVAGELWNADHAGRVAKLLGAGSGALLGHHFLGPIGGVGGFFLGHRAGDLAVHRLGELRLAKQNQLNALRPGYNPNALAGPMMGLVPGAAGVASSGAQ